jgi:tRNA(adenine34) deaminase
MDDRMKEIDDRWMELALEQARVAGAAGDVPVGAVIVSDVSSVGGEAVIIGRGHNRREVDRDPTAHAEIVALRQAASQLGIWRVEATLYVTQEPCPMCAGALVNARVKRLVYGCPNPKAGAVKTLFSLVTDPRLNHRMEVTQGVRGDECAQLLRGFFAALRRGPTYEGP